jgi:hypothetical protein
MTQPQPQQRGGWIEALAGELCQRKYRTLCEAELIDLIRRYARSGHVNCAMDIDGETPIAHCGDCGHRLTLVRPGKHQCDNIACEGNQ